ncbi:uncharacterized protein AB675_533 [Cyphellophora attinorum]|uniref:Uncharacterized protein n=1 Tax=Cyphellophora attinorum TaxID=1664694 RepID=A0A0N1P1U5_9EURO|nr:uncharacterized protein AB675_533 [Phialophora attinorum]KPI45467.1 hypothetical protein AB675_533 [Phialophora attinorum]
MTQEQCLDSFAERTRAFQIDDSQEELGHGNHINYGPEAYNKPKIYQRDLGQLSVIGSLKRVKYGTWHQEPACLISMKFQFQNGNARTLRLTKADIQIEFTSRPVSTPDADPKLLEYGPKYLQSNGTIENRTWNYVATLSANATLGSAEVGPQLELGAGGSFSKNFAAEVEVDDWGNGNHQRPNCLRVWMREDKKQESGIPQELHLTAIVSSSGAMQATVQVRANNIFHLLAWPWSARDPVLLQPGVEYGDKIRDVDFDFSALTSDEWRRMVTPDLESR